MQQLLILFIFLGVLFLHRKVLANFFRTKRWRRSKAFLFVILLCFMLLFLHLDVIKHNLGQVFSTSNTKITFEE